MRLVAVADTQIDRLQGMKIESGAHKVRRYQDYNTMLQMESDLDAVVIATPIPFHREIAECCIARGLYVLLEKPPVALIQDLDALVKLDAHSASK
jgi:predicted dehydrogenase